jgi:serpin B
MHAIKMLSSAVLLLSCIASAAFSQEKPGTPTDAARTLARGGNAFALNMYRQLCSAEGNLFLSPHSIRTALAMTYTGARGQTAAQMKTALEFSLDGDELHKAFADTIAALNTTADSSHEMNIANSLWADTTRTFQQPFIDINKKYYSAGLEQVDFIRNSENARIKINIWVEKQTQQKIKDLIPPGGVTADTRLTLVNAVYFKGRWAEAFDTKLTHTEPFYCAEGRTLEAPLMTFSEPKSLPFFAGEGVKVLELDYLGDNVSMIIVLPDNSDGLAAIEERLDEALLSAWLLNMNKRPVSVHLPRFSITWGAENLVPHLRALGMQDAFARGAADFSGIDGTRELLITSVFHKAFVDVYEEGTEAAAATGLWSVLHPCRLLLKFFAPTTPFCS